MIPEGLPLMKFPISLFFKSNASVLKVMACLEEGELTRGGGPPPISWVEPEAAGMLRAREWKLELLRLGLGG